MRKVTRSKRTTSVNWEADKSEHTILRLTKKGGSGKTVSNAKAGNTTTFKTLKVGEAGIMCDLMWFGKSKKGSDEVSSFHRMKAYSQAKSQMAEGIPPDEGATLQRQSSGEIFRCPPSLPRYA